jgi:hypothetical protein
MTMSSTHDLFIDFASFGAGRQTLQQMDGRSFAKLCRDCRLIDRALTLIDVDILFTKVKVRHHSRTSTGRWKSSAMDDVRRSNRGTPKRGRARLLAKPRSV